MSHDEGTSEDNDSIESRSIHDDDNKNKQNKEYKDMKEKNHVLDYSNQTCLVRLEESEKAEEYLRNEVKRSKEKMRQAHAEVNIKRDELEACKDELSYYEYENGLIEATLENQTEELSSS